jgi:DNA-binding transcriptional MerR regulator
MTATTESEPTLRIGEVAEQVGVNPKTIRYCEEIGLISQPGRRPSGYRVYHAEDAERISFIKRAQRFGLSLDEIREVLAYQEDGKPPCELVVAAVRRHADEVEARIAELTRLRDELAELIDRADDTPDAVVPVRGDARHRLVDVVAKDGSSSWGRGWPPTVSDLW